MLVRGVCGDLVAASIHLVSFFITTNRSVTLLAFVVGLVEMNLVDTPAGAVAGVEIDVASVATGVVIAEEVAVVSLSCYRFLRPIDSMCRGR